MTLPVVSVAPLVDVTTRHFRYVMRLLTKRAHLYTPMLLARRVAGRKKHEVMQTMLRFDRAEIVEGRGETWAQLGGDEPRTMIRAALRCEEAGFSGVNVNLGCPARSAKAGNHGALLMRPKQHAHVASLLRAMGAELAVPLSVKLRVGLEQRES